MARFKFGKNKKKDGSIDVNASMDSDATSIEAGSPNLDNNLPVVTVQGANFEKLERQPQNIPSRQEPPASILKGGNMTPSYPVPSSTPWLKHKLKNSPFPRYRHSASTISSEKNEIYLMGGLKEGSVFGDTWKVTPIVNPETNQVVDYTAENIVIVNNNNPPARVGHSSVLIGNAYIIYGGDTVDTDFNGFPDNNFYLFNINNNKYTIPSHILNKPNGRYGHTIGVVSLNSQSSRLYLFGGQLENDVFNDLYYFELNTFKSPKARWNLVEPLNNFRPPPLTNHTMSVYKNKIYVFGGVYNNEKVSNDLWSFDVASSKWTQISTSGNIPLPVNEHAACIINDKLFIYGGNDFSGIIYNSLYVLDLHTLEWSKLTSDGEVDGPGARCGHSMTYIPNLNKLLIMGGDKNDYVSSDPNDFNTYETKDPNVELDTMIYELDLDSISHFLSSKQTVVKATKKSINGGMNGSSDLNDFAPTAEPTHSSSVNEYPPTMAASDRLPDIATAAVLGGAGTAAGAVTTNNVVSGSNSDLRQGFERHGRSFSAGPEDFRTPEASPERKKQEDKFIDVPSSAVSEKGIITDEDYSKDVPEPDLDMDSYSGGYTNGHSGTHARNKSVDQEAFANTPDLSKTSNVRSGSAVVGGSAAAGVAAGIGSRAASGSSENEKVKKLINELTAELTSLKQTTKLEMQNATEKINRLEEENKQLKSVDGRKLQDQLKDKDLIISQLKQQIDPSLVQIDEEGENKAIDPDSSNSITELTRYKLERLELNNKLVYLTKENESLREKIEEFEPFMNNQIGQLTDFQKIISKQEEKIKALVGQVKDQESLNKELNEWKAKYQNLEIEFQNYKSIHADDDIEVTDDEVDDESHDTTNKSILSNSTTKRSKKDISNHLENLVQAWNSRNISSASSARGISVGETSSNKDAVDPMVLELQKQLDSLMKISKEQEVTTAREISNLKNELALRSNDIKSYEQNYKDALQSVNNTSKALKLTQEELNNKNLLMEKLVKENNELNLFKKASKRTSTRTPLVGPGHDFNVDAPIKEDDNEDDEESAIENAHFNMKIKDLEADLFILKQERDQLKQNVTNLQKQLYLSQSSP